MTKTMAEVIREELRKGSYQMPGDTLPYETQAAAIAAQLSAAGIGLVADAGAKALEDAADWVMGPSDYMTDGGTCRYIAGYLRQHAKDMRATNAHD